MSDKLKTFRVCLSSELPSLLDRDPKFIYFLYDKLVLFFGQNLYNDPFAIVESIPDNPVNGLLYICINDGYCKIYHNHQIYNIASIEDESQIEILKQSGTTFFTNAERRYLDLQRRIITLPYQNGSYELTVSLANDIMIDENTIIKYNIETKQFEIFGKHQDYGMLFTSDYKGVDTKTVKTTVSSNKISSEVKISDKADNIIKILSDGLYASASDKVKKEEFNLLVKKFDQYKTQLDNFMEVLEKEITEAQIIVSEESISKKIKEAIEEVYPDIENIINSYDTVLERIEGIELRSKEYTDTSFEEAREDLSNMISQAMSDPWGEF